jgi:methyltransferase-like protein/SAM-dependent methyltransferase
MSDLENPYDRVPYPSPAFLQTHPDRLAVVGTLLGMSPPPVERCRVLEIGCGEGGNLIPMAYGLPESQFVGIDLAARPIESARTRIHRAGLKNVRAYQMNVTDVTPEFGTFDYVIVQGLYSWVPEPVREMLLTVCGQNLSANGIAFVSYNTAPAGHVRRILREMIIFHASRGKSGVRVEEGKAFLQHVLSAMDTGTPWGRLYEEDLARMFNRPDNVVYHDDLSPDFSPVSFSQFASHAARRGLQFLGESQLSEVTGADPAPGALAALKEIAAGDVIAYEQYLDYVKFRRFRQTLLCREGVPLDRNGLLGRLACLLVASPLRAASEGAGGGVSFANSRADGTITTNDPLLVAALRHIETTWPHAVRFEELLAVARARVPAAQVAEASAGLSLSLWRLAAGALVDLRTYHPRLAAGVSERPAASLLARLSVQDSSVVTTLLHTQLHVEDDLGKRFLVLLDGSRDREALASAISDGSPRDTEEEVARQVDGSLLDLYRAGLLVA